MLSFFFMLKIVCIFWNFFISIQGIFIPLLKASLKSKLDVWLFFSVSNIFRNFYKLEIVCFRYIISIYVISHFYKFFTQSWSFDFFGKKLKNTLSNILIICECLWQNKSGYFLFFVDKYFFALSIFRFFDRKNYI